MAVLERNVPSLYLMTGLLLLPALLRVTVDAISVLTNPEVILQKGTIGMLPCTLDAELAVGFVTWSKGPTPLEAELIAELNFLSGTAEKLYGPGSNASLYDIDEEFSLKIVSVRMEDYDLFYCELVTMEAGESYINHTNVIVFALPKMPFPTIDECGYISGDQNLHRNCSLATTSALNITCSAFGYYPSITLFFTHNSNMVDYLVIREWNNTDGTRNKAASLTALPSDEPYLCVASDIPGYAGQEKLSHVFLYVPSSTGTGSNEESVLTTPKVGYGSSASGIIKIIVPVLSAVMIIVVAVVLAARSYRKSQDGTSGPPKVGSAETGMPLLINDDPATSTLLGDKALCLKEKQSLSAYIFGLDTRTSLTTLILHVLPESARVARQAALSIFTMETIRILILFCKEQHSEEIYIAMADYASSSKIEYIALLDCKLKETASQCCAQGIFSMPSLRTLSLKNVEFSSTFYEIMVTEALNSKIDTFAFGDESEITGSVSSHHFAKGLLSIPELRAVNLFPYSLDNEFYQTLVNEGARSLSSIEKLNFGIHTHLGSEPSRNFMDFVLSLPNLTTLMIDGIGHLDESSFVTFRNLSTICKVEKLWIENLGNHTNHTIRELVKCISTMPKLRSLAIREPGRYLLDAFYMTMLNYPASLKITTFTLKSATVTQGNIKAFLSIKTLQSVRFIDLDAKIGVATQTFSEDAAEEQESFESHVQDLTVDDISLPGLVKLGLHRLCPRLKHVQLAMKTDLQNHILMHLQGFHFLICLEILAFRNLVVEVLPRCSVSLKDLSLLCDLLKTSWPKLKILTIKDIRIHNMAAAKILETCVERIGISLEKVILTRCGTTSEIDPVSERVRSESSLLLTITHGEPRLRSTCPNDTLYDMFKNHTRNFHDSAFTVIEERQ